MWISISLTISDPNLKLYPYKNIAVEEIVSQIVDKGSCSFFVLNLERNIHKNRKKVTHFLTKQKSETVFPRHKC